MKVFSKQLIILSISAGLCVSSLVGCGAANRNNQQPNNVQQGRNMIGDNTQGVNPNNGPGTANPNGLSGNNPDGRGLDNQIGNPQGNNMVTPAPDMVRDQTTPGTGYDNVRYTPQQVNDGRGKADNIKRQLGTMRDINNVNVVVLGNSALVGFTKNNAGVDAGVIRDRVAARVKEIDKSITNVLATDAPDMVPDISRLSNDVTNNNAADTIGNSFNKLMRNINAPR